MPNVRSILLFSGAAFALAGRPAFSQENTPAESPVPAATTAPTTETRPTKPATPAKPATATKQTTATKSTTPASAAVATATASTNSAADDERDDAFRREKSVVDDLKDEITYRYGRAHRSFDRGQIAAAQKDEVGRAIDRASTQVDTQLARVVAALDSKSPELPGSPEHVQRLAEEMRAMTKIAKTGSDEIEAVRTHDDDTEESLQRVADEAEKVSDRADELFDKLDELHDKQVDRDDERSDSDTDTDTDAGTGDDGAGVHGIGIIKNGHHGVRVGMNTDNDRVVFGNGIEVKKDQKVDSAVAFGGPVTVEGDVKGDAVAFGGNVHVTETGHVHGDAASFGGRVVVDDGGKVDGEKTQMGPGAVGKAMLGGSSHPDAPEESTPWLVTIGERLVKAGAEFICFFLLGMLVLALAPKRMMIVADALEKHPVKAGGLGFLAWLSVLPITVLLGITIVGIILWPVLWIGMVVAGFFGYVALALVIGRKLPMGVIPTNTALLAIGAALIVVLGLVPLLGALAWIVMAWIALGAVAMTRFGEDRNTPPPTSSDTLEAAA